MPVLAQTFLITVLNRSEIHKNKYCHADEKLQLSVLYHVITYLRKILVIFKIFWISYFLYKSQNWESEVERIYIY
ncbi:hypothetical protein BpHYR1_028604 [Brachionus plicatilis]|uniref:Uncharacterized protein n=1 Tax=Brachionus plicatilis TaxID=10195 RepID=A0A3M7QRW9_BRAPC|nr:hypothetical protein BpHYR1_028604 [Brachionus plicatilis]